MKQQRDKKGFTLVEVVVTLVILAVLAAILVPAMTGWMREAEEKKCLSELGGIRRSYQAEAAYLAYSVGDPAPLLASAAAEWGGSGLGATSFICPCGNEGSVLYAADYAGIVSIRCSVHGGTSVSAAYGIAQGWNIPLSSALASVNGKTIADYFNAANRTAAGASLDSEGGNWAPGVKSLLDSLGYASSSWSIVRYENNGGFYVYWSDEDITAKAIGDSVSCVRVTLTKDGQLVEGSEQSGTVAVAQRTTGGLSFPIFDGDTYRADGTG
ncbi:MAG: prepilin-type N-terminal cleavage/methylation domain-containing protein [Clostridia bacterium]|nr:prepilin-type N-terminal cleavage/methylation domain-containing protein [Clostridia bacterium]